jgi:exonuclease VII large subunit
MTTLSRPLFAVLASALLLVGCRTYGDEGYNSESKLYSAIQQTVKQTEQDLGRAQSDLRRLESAAESSDTLAALAERYRTLVRGHEATLQNYERKAERLTPGSGYRTLHRTYGAMVTDRRLLNRQYQRTVRKVWATVRDSTIPRTPTRLKSSYVITPVQYPLTDHPDLTMAEALQGVEGTLGLQREEQPGGSD